MKRMISLVIVVVAFVIMVDDVSAQIRSRGGHGYYPARQSRYYGGGYYDPAYLQQMIQLPDGLVACTVDLATAKVASCHPVVKDVALIEAHAHDHADRAELLGTVHVDKDKFHFRPFDDTNGRLGTFSGGGLGAGAGAMVGYGSTRGMRNRGKANAIGATTTIGGGLLAG